MLKTPCHTIHGADDGEEGNEAEEAAVVERSRMLFHQADGSREKIPNEVNN